MALSRRGTSGHQVSAADDTAQPLHRRENPIQTVPTSIVGIEEAPTLRTVPPLQRSEIDITFSDNASGFRLYGGTPVVGSVDAGSYAEKQGLTTMMYVGAINGKVINVEGDETFLEDIWRVRPVTIKFLQFHCGDRIQVVGFSNRYHNQAGTLLSDMHMSGQAFLKNPRRFRVKFDKQELGTKWVSAKHLCPQLHNLRQTHDVVPPST